MKYVLMKSSGGFKRVVPVEKSKRNINKVVKQPTKPAEEKVVDVAEYNIKDDDFSRELKKGTDRVLKGYLKNYPPIPISYIGLDRDINAVIEEALINQDKENRKKKRESRREKLKSFKKKLFRRRNDG